MFSKLIRLMTGILLAVGLAAGTAEAADNTVTIGHFGSALPFVVALKSGEFERATGWKIEWRTFGSGTDVIAAMASGDVKIALLGSSAFVIGATQGVDYQLFAISDEIGDSEALIARNGSGIEKLADLKGKKIATPLGSTSHFSLMGAMKMAGLSAADATILGMQPAQIYAAWEQGQIDAAYVWDPVKTRILKSGTMIIRSDQVSGVKPFDGWVVDRQFAQANPEFLKAFLKTLAAADSAYNANPAAWTADSEPVKAIAASIGENPSDIPTELKGLIYPSLAEMASQTWLGGGVVANMAETAKFLLENKRIDHVLSDYSRFVNASFVHSAM